jgi:hypothetical protein
MHIVLLIFLFGAIDGSQISSPVMVNNFVNEKCGVPSEKCFCSAIDSIWLKTSIEEKVSICRYLAESPEPYASTYLKMKLEVEKESFIKYLLLNALIVRRAPEDILFLSRLLPDSIPIGREGDRMSDLILAYFQYSIPIEYNFHHKTFLNSKKYRESIAAKYTRWYKNLSKPVRWEKEFECFMIPGTSQDIAEHHKAWYLAIQGKE